MLTSLALVFLAGVALASVCQRLKLPRIIGMLVSGILLGPCVLNLLDPWCFSGSASNGPCHYFDKGGSVTQNRGPKKGGQAGCVDVICPGHV